VLSSGAGLARSRRGYWTGRRLGIFQLLGIFQPGGIKRELIYH
jgi:hypothetical protein